MVKITASVKSRFKQPDQYGIHEYTIGIKMLNSVVKGG